MSQGSSRTLWELLGTNIQEEQPPEVWLELTPLWDQEGQPSGGRLNALAGRMPHGKDSLGKTLELKQTHK